MNSAIKVMRVGIFYNLFFCPLNGKSFIMHAKAENIEIYFYFQMNEKNFFFLCIEGKSKATEPYKLRIDHP